MTDNEIKKALEHHKKRRCFECPLRDIEKSCSVTISTLALDLINRQQAEIERLEKESADKERAYTEEYILRKELKSQQNTIKAEAIKEFKSKVENDIVILLGKSNCTEFIDCLEYRYKEMVGEC